MYLNESRSSVSLGTNLPAEAEQRIVKLVAGTVSVILILIIAGRIFIGIQYKRAYKDYVPVTAAVIDVYTPSEDFDDPADYYAIFSYKYNGTDYISEMLVDESMSVSAGSECTIRIDPNSPNKIASEKQVSEHKKSFTMGCILLGMAFIATMIERINRRYKMAGG